MLPHYSSPNERRREKNDDRKNGKNVRQSVETKLRAVHGVYEQSKKNSFVKSGNGKTANGEDSSGDPPRQKKY